jgi:methylase of polypeptide subunit release factors
MLSIWKNVGDPILDMRSDHTIPIYDYSKIFKIIIGQDYSRIKGTEFPEHTLSWYTDGSRAESGTGSGICGLRLNCNLSFSLGNFATVFQTEIYAILQCAYENIRRASKSKWILILSDSQAALKALSSPKGT